MAISDDRILVDTNVLVAVVFLDHPQHLPARSFFDRLQEGAISVCVVPQVLVEFYSTVTDARRVASPRTPEEALDTIEKFLAMPGITLLPVPLDAFTRWVDLVRQHPVKNGAVFDHFLVAAMLGLSIHKIYTFNQKDFEVFNEIEVFSP